MPDPMTTGTALTLIWRLQVTHGICLAVRRDDPQTAGYGNMSYALVARRVRGDLSAPLAPETVFLLESNLAHFTTAAYLAYHILDPMDEEDVAAYHDWTEVCASRVLIDEIAHHVSVVRVDGRGARVTGASVE